MIVPPASRGAAAGKTGSGRTGSDLQRPESGAWARICKKRMQEVRARICKVSEKKI